MSKRFKKGFTLIELLIVIAIIAILAVVVITNVMGARQKANDSKLMSDMSETQKAVLQCVATDGTPRTVPTTGSLGGLSVCMTTTTVANTYPSLPTLTATRIKSSNGAYWVYSAGTNYDLPTGTFTYGAIADSATATDNIITCNESGCTKTGF